MASRPTALINSPVDDTIWYSKLNGNRIGRIDPKSEDDNIKEWNPLFRGPQWLHAVQDGIVWVRGFGSGVFGKFNPKTEEWRVLSTTRRREPDSVRLEYRSERLCLDLWHGQMTPGTASTQRPRLSRVPHAVPSHVYSGNRVRR